MAFRHAFVVDIFGKSRNQSPPAKNKLLRAGLYRDVYGETKLLYYFWVLGLWLTVEPPPQTSE